MKSCTDLPQERVVGMTGGSLLQLEQRRPVCVKVEIGGRYEVTEDAHSMDVDDSQSGALNERGDSSRVETPWQWVRGAPATIVAGERALSLSELPGERPGEHSGDAGGHHEADVSAIGEHAGNRSQGRRRVVDELERAMAAHEISIGVGVHLEQVCRIALHCDDPLSNSGVSSPAIERGQSIEAGVDDRDMVTELGQRNGHAAGTTAEVDDAQTAAELLLALDHDGTQGLPDS